MDGQRIVLTTNRGLVMSTDGGASFHLYCASAMGINSAYDVPLRLMSDGRVMLATYDGVQRSSADYCDFAVAGLDIGSTALAVHPSEPLTTMVATNIAPDRQALYRTTDGGESFERLAELPDGAFFLLGLAYAPSDPLRVYGTALGPNAAGDAYEYSIVASDDGGATLQQHLFAVDEEQSDPRLWAVDPNDAQTLYVQVPGLPEYGRLDALMRSTDGGQTFSVIHELDTMRAFAIAPDGSALWVGGLNGAWVSTDGGDSFEPLIEDRIVTCLAQIDGQLWVCIDGEGKGSFPGLSHYEDDGETLTHVMSFDDVDELPACAADSAVGSSCDMAWDDWTLELLTPVVDPDAGMFDAGTTGGEAGMMAGASDASMDDAGIGDGGSGGGCGCRIGARRRAPAPWLWLLGLAAALYVRRRRRR